MAVGLDRVAPVCALWGRLRGLYAALPLDAGLSVAHPLRGLLDKGKASRGHLTATLMGQHVGAAPVGVLVLGLGIGQARQSPKVPPVGAVGVAAVLLGQHRGHLGGQLRLKALFMHSHPCLKVVRAGLGHAGRGQSCGLQPGQLAPVEVVHQHQAGIGFACWPDVHVRALGVLTLEPGHGLQGLRL